MRLIIALLFISFIVFYLVLLYLVKEDAIHLIAFIAMEFSLLIFTINGNSGIFK